MRNGHDFEIVPTRPDPNSLFHLQLAILWIALLLIGGSQILNTIKLHWRIAELERIVYFQEDRKP